jgi:ATP-binding protein involved in chromosome partitioning
MSGKGGVGKSTIAANLARSLSSVLPTVGLLDLDLTGPSIPTLFGIRGQSIKSQSGKMIPFSVGNIEIISIGLLLEDPNDAVIWRGPRKHGMLSSFFEKIKWTSDVIVVDLPPGTSDEHISTFEILKEIPYSVFIVTSPSLLAVADVRKGINLCRTVGARLVGSVENFCGVMCPCCGKVTPLTDDTAVDSLSMDTGLPIVARIPFMPMAATEFDEGKGSDVIMDYFRLLIPVALE